MSAVRRQGGQHGRQLPVPGLNQLSGPLSLVIDPGAPWCRTSSRTPGQAVDGATGLTYGAILIDSSEKIEIYK